SSTTTSPALSRQRSACAPFGWSHCPMGPPKRGRRSDGLRSREGSPPGSRMCFGGPIGDRKSTRLNSSHGSISYAVFCLKKQHRFLVGAWRTRPTSSPLGGENRVL